MSETLAESIEDGQRVITVKSINGTPVALSQNLCFVLVDTGSGKQLCVAVKDYGIDDVLRYKGSVATYEDLPSATAQTGDVYNVLSDGKNYAWTGTEWDDFGGAITVSISSASDVSLSSLANGDILIYNSTTEKWENGSITLTDIATAGSGIRFDAAVSSTNMTIIGSPNIDSLDNYKMTGISDSNYVILNSNFPATGTIKIVTRYKHVYWNANNQVLLGFKGTSVQGCCLLVYKNNVADKNKLNIWDGANDITGTTQLTQSIYWIGLEFNTSTNAFKCYLMHDDGTYTKDTLPDFSNAAWSTEINATLNSNIFSGNTVAIGKYLVGNNFYVRGAIYLGDTWVDVNGTYYTSPYTFSSTKKQVQTTAIQNAAKGSDSLSILGSSNTSTNNVSVGVGADSSSNYSVCIGGPDSNGNNSYTTGNYSTAIGTGVISEGIGGISIGANSRVYSTGSYSIAIGGSQNKSTFTGIGGSYSIAIGYDASVATNRTYAIQLGTGNNSTSNTMNVGLSSTLNVQLLDNLGQIPTARYKTFTGADGANAGLIGAVPAPSATDNTKFLRGDGTWQTVSGSASYDSTTQTITL